jgi:hypothetical protein
MRSDKFNEVVYVVRVCIVLLLVAVLLSCTVRYVTVTNGGPVTVDQSGAQQQDVDSRVTPPVKAASGGMK